MNLSVRFEAALRYAVIIHAGQMRKGTGVPYVSHLLGVASLVLEYGGTEDEAIGALLHDAGEDAGGDGRIEDIRQRFGDNVADIVRGCTDTVESPKPPWRARKEAYVAHLPSAPAAVRLVSAADKLYNARAILRDYRRIGDEVWVRFSGGREGTLWYYGALVRAYQAAGTGEVIEELERTVAELSRLTGERGSH
jgi:(p)ppGpp synthase/HD superfamily hydrolase